MKGITVLVCFALVLSGCGHYSFSPSLQKGGVRSVSVPTLGNETLEYGIESDVTEALVDVFADDGTLRVLGENEADAIIRGAVTAYDRSVLSYDAGGDPREYKVRVVARLSYERIAANEVLWEGDAEGWAVYATEGESENTTEDEARAEALEKLADDVLSKTVQGW